MKVIYDKHQEMYAVILEHPETATFVHTKDIVEAREVFIDCMTRLFNDAICEKLME